MATEPRARLAWQNARIAGIDIRTSRVRSFWLECPQPFAFEAGQHVDLRLTAPDGYQAQRSYSIASAPADGPVIELAIELMPNGEVSPFFHEVATVGDEIELRGPIGGHFIWRPEEEAPVLLVGGGSGIVPLMSMARERGKRGSAAPVLMLYSARSWDDVIFRDELVALGGRHDGFELVFALTRDTAKRPGDFSRRVDEAMMRELVARLPAPPKVFVCGSNPFVESAAQGALAAGVQFAMIRTERYGG